MSFRFVPKSVTLNDLERRNGGLLRYFSEFGYLPGALRKSSSPDESLSTFTRQCSNTLKEWWKNLIMYKYKILGIFLRI